MKNKILVASLIALMTFTASPAHAAFNGLYNRFLICSALKANYDQAQGQYNACLQNGGTLASCFQLNIAAALALGSCIGTCGEAFCSGNGGAGAVNVQSQIGAQSE